MCCPQTHVRAVPRSEAMAPSERPKAQASPPVCRVSVKQGRSAFELSGDQILGRGGSESCQAPHSII